MSRVEVWLAVTVGEQRQHARDLLRRAAASVLQVGADDLIVAREPGGRPYVTLPPARSRGGSVPAARVSVSHTRGLTAVAVSTGGDVGVDVEAVRDLPASALARRWFGSEEARWIESHDAALRTRALLWVWTHKEALAKAVGTGLARGGLARPVPLPASGVPEHPARKPPVLRETAPGSGLTSVVPQAPDGYVLCLAGGRGTDGLPVSVRGGDG